MNDPGYQRELSVYRRMPRETAILAFSLASLGVSFVGLLSAVFLALSITTGIFWLLITFFVAKEPRYPRGFVYLEPVVLVALLASLGVSLIFTWLNTGFSEAVITLLQVLFSGILGTAVITWVVRIFT